MQTDIWILGLTMLVIMVAIYFSFFHEKYQEPIHIVQEPPVQEPVVQEPVDEIPEEDDEIPRISQLQMTHTPIEEVI